MQEEILQESSEITQEWVKKELKNLIRSGELPKEFLLKEKIGTYIGVLYNPKKRTVIRIEPKFDYDYIAMAEECSSDRDALRRLLQKDFIAFFHNKEKVRLKLASSQNYPLYLIYIFFLAAVEKLVKKGLKRDYKRIERSLRGKVKGKIDVAKTVKNHLKGRHLHTHCKYNAFLEDHFENRYIKSALLECKRFFNFASQNNSVFDDTTRNRLSSLLKKFSDVQPLRQKSNLKRLPKAKNRFFTEYVSALKLAHMVLNNFTLVSNTKTSTSHELMSYQFYINTAQLFESYCELHLKKIFPELKTQKNQKIDNVIKGKNGLRADFIVPNLNFIIDSKYKPSDKVSIEDIQQICCYGRVASFREKGCEPKLFLLYPKPKESKKIDIKKIDCEKKFYLSLRKMERLEGFEGVYKIYIELP